MVGIGFTSMAQAEETPPDDRWYVAPFGTYLRAGGDRDSNDGFGGGMGFGKMIDEHFNVELKGFYQYAGGEGTHPWNSGARTFANSGGYYNNGNWDLTGGTADVQYFIFRDTFSPYTVLGVGGMNTSHNGRSGATFIGEAGAGFTYEVSDNFLLRSDVPIAITTISTLTPSLAPTNSMTWLLMLVSLFHLAPNQKRL
jgi:OOP family OmpA-OmpF porin